MNEKEEIQKVINLVYTIEGRAFNNNKIDMADNLMKIRYSLEDILNDETIYETNDV